MKKNVWLIVSIILFVILIITSVGLNFYHDSFYELSEICDRTNKLNFETINQCENRSNDLNECMSILRTCMEKIGYFDND